MIIGTILLILTLSVYFLISAAIIYHLVRYSPEKNRSILLIGIYIAVSFILLIITTVSFFRIDWNNLL